MSKHINQTEVLYFHPHTDAQGVAVNSRLMELHGGRLLILLENMAQAVRNAMATHNDEMHANGMFLIADGGVMEAYFHFSAGPNAVCSAGLEVLD